MVKFEYQDELQVRSIVRVETNINLLNDEILYHGELLDTQYANI